MALILLIRYICGYVKFSAYGVYCERFINLLHYHGISIWDFSKKDMTLTAYVKASDYKNMRKYAKKTGIKMRIQKKYGLPFVWNKYKKRIGFFIGVIVFLVVLSIMSNFVLTIEVAGNENVSSEKIIATLEELGIKKGTIPKDSEFYFIEQRALLKLPELSWLAINRKGSNVCIDVKERALPPEIIDLTIPCDIVAKKDGYITKINAFRGNEVVAERDSVLEGDILVAGKITDSQGNTIKVHSQAEIEAETENVFVVKQKSKQDELKQTGNMVTKRTLNLFGLNIPLYFSSNKYENYQKNDSYAALTIFDFTFPFSMKKELYKETKMETITYTEEEMKLNAYNEAERIIRMEYSGVTILNTVYKEELLSDGSEFILTTTLKCKENIGVEKRID